MPRATTLPAPKFDLHRHTLSNGLRVVLAPDRTAPVVCVSVLYDVGFRSEPEGRTGFAHLFEHLMFQGSHSLEKLEHFRYVQSSGGSFNGSTHPDYTDYFETLPSNALERALFLEADRMRSPRITAENLANQLEVVKNEIRVNVLNRPYGGFPWIYLPAVLFDSFANSHNGYGGFEDLEAATVEDATDFFKRYYAPANAVLCVAGDLDVEQTVGLIEKHFGPLPRRARPKRPSFAEPELTAPRRATHDDPHATTPAVAVGYRVADPVDDVEGLAALSCWPRCSPTATPRACSAAWSSATGWSPTSAPTSVRSVIRSTSATPPCSRCPRTTRTRDRWRRSWPRSTTNWPPWPRTGSRPANSTASAPGWVGAAARPGLGHLAHPQPGQVRAASTAGPSWPWTARRARRPDRRRHRRGRGRLRPERRAVLELIAGGAR